MKNLIKGILKEYIERKFIKPEFEIKEFFRVFKENLNSLPPNIDKSIFNGPEPKEFEKHVDPPYGGKFDTEKLLEVTDKKYHPFIKYCEQLFNSGKLVELPIDYIKKNISSFKRGDWVNFIKNPKEWENIIQKHKESKNPKYSAYQSYFKDSFAEFDKMSNVPAPNFLKVGDKFNIIGGNRRMSYFIKNNINPTIWVINSQ